MFQAAIFKDIAIATREIQPHPILRHPYSSTKDMQSIMVRLVCHNIFLFPTAVAVKIQYFTP